MALCVVSVLAVALAGRADAACETSDRVQPADSDCLDAIHGNKYYTAWNFCSHGIRVKLDIANGADSTFDMDGWSGSGPAPKKEGSIDTSWWRWLRDVTCCSDHSSCDHNE